MKLFYKTTILWAGLFMGFSTMAQNLSSDWLQKKHVKERDEFKLSVFVESSSQPFVVNYLEQVTPPVPNGPTFPRKHYLYAYDANGNFMWSKQFMSGMPYKLLSGGEGKFWVLAWSSSNDIQIGSQVLTSNFPDPTYDTLFFVEMDDTGTVVNYFTYSAHPEIFMDIRDAAFDKNGDFILAGTIRRPNFSSNDPPVPFSFGNFTTALDWDYKRLYYVARMYKNGTQGEFFDYDAPSSNPDPENVPDYIAVNSNNGNIFFTGRFGESLEINSTVYQNPHPFPHSFPQLYMGLLDESLNLIAFDTAYVSSYGTIVRDAIYNEMAQSFYFTGSWGDELGYGFSPPLQDNNAHRNSAYLAKLLPNSLTLDTIVPFITQTNALSRFTYLTGMATAEDGSLYISGFATDSTIQIGTQMHTINTDAFSDFEGLLLKFDADLNLKSLLKSNDHGNCLFRSVTISNIGDVYCSGQFLEDFSMGNLSATAFATTLDALLVKFSAGNFGYEETTNPSKPFLVYPNPTHGQLKISIPNRPNAPFNVDIFDIDGRKVGSHNFPSEKKTVEINVGGLAPGIYIVRLKSGKESLFQKIIVH